MDTGAVLLPLVGGAALVGFYAAFFVWQRRASAGHDAAFEAWLAGWRARGFRAEGRATEFALDGELDGVRVRWDQRQALTQVAGEERFALARSAWAQSAVSLEGVEVVPRAGLARLGAALGGVDVVLGDAEFDRAFVVRAGARDGALRVLGPAARAAMVGALARVGDVGVRDGRVCWVGEVTNPSSPELVLGELARVVRALGG